MTKLIPLAFLFATFAVFGISWIVVRVDPDTASWYVFGLLVLLLFIVSWGFLGVVLYLIRTRFYRRYSGHWYFKTSFKMAFFIALFVAACAILAILNLVTTLNVGLTSLALGLFATWSYLGRKS